MTAASAARLLDDHVAAGTRLLGADAMSRVGAELCHAGGCGQAAV